MEQKNFLAAVILSITFLFLWFTFVMPRFSPPPVTTPAPAAVSETSSVTVAETPAVIAPAAGGHEVSAAAATDVVLRDTENEIAIALRGGAVRSWRLKLKGHDIDLVNAPDASLLPLATFPQTPFKARAQDRAVTLTAPIASGVELTKTLALSPTGFLNSLTLRFRNTTGQPVTVKDWELGWGPGLGTTATEHKENAALTRTISLGQYDNIRVLKPGEYTEIGQWGAIDNRYFMVAFIPPPGVQGAWVVTGTKGDARLALRQSTTVPAKGEVTLQYQLYVGPKGYTQLKKYGKHLEAGVDFGFFSGIGKLILSALYTLQKWTGNYGWAIVLLTIGLQILMLPLTMKSLKSQVAMRRLQPQIAALQKKFKGDPKQLNLEMLKLYKTSKTNPFGGCLPMILQLPIFWALFTTLRNAYELRGAPFVFWIHDLSAADPWRVLPIIMGGAMFVQQRMTGAMTDPTQRQMMMIMPVMFTVMFINFPAGLVLYWLTNNLVMLGFQYAMQRSQTPPGKGTPDSPFVVKR
jgi:YidC/Oxa1 family membrane protein insertase